MAEFLEGIDGDMNNSEVKCKEMEMYNMGLSDGLAKGNEEQFQTGFNEGFKEGDAFGKCVGIINASIKILELCFRNSTVDPSVRSSFETWKKEIESVLVPPQLELKQSQYDVLKAVKLGIIIDRLRDIFSALKMKDCIMMKLLDTIAI